MAEQDRIHIDTPLPPHGDASVHIDVPAGAHTDTGGQHIDAGGAPAHIDTSLPHIDAKFPPHADTKHHIDTPAGPHADASVNQPKPPEPKA